MSPSPSRRVSPGEDDIETTKMPRLSQTQTGVTISPELFEKLYLTPKTPHLDESYKRFANITPLGLVGFVISTFTFSMILMGWGGASGLYGEIGIFFFVAPLLLTISFICEWIVGNFFSMMVMGTYTIEICSPNSRQSYRAEYATTDDVFVESIETFANHSILLILGMFSVFWLSFGMLNLPTLGLAAAYSPSGTNATVGGASPEYNAGIGIFLIVWGFSFFTYFFFTLKTNVVFASIFFFATTAIWILAGAYFRVSTGDYGTAGALQKVSNEKRFKAGCLTNEFKAGGALLFVVALLGWYMTVVIMSAEMRMPFSLPVGDLSHLWPSSNVPITEAEKQA